MHITISQIINHWIVLEINNDNMIFLHDSAYTTVVGNGKQVIARLLKTDKNTFSVNIMHGCWQTAIGAAECGLYAIAMFSTWQ